MKKNMGGADRIIRILAVIAIAVLAYLNIISGTLMYVLFGVAGIFLLTSLVGTCPLYMIIGLKTCKTKE